MNPKVLRILDANANRAREGLRIVEDYARFVLDDGGLCGSLKQIRHDLAAALSKISLDAILHRDTAGDVGTTTKTAAEQSREDIAHVVTAAGKRLGEALRTLEEYLKMFDAPAAAQIESLRYRFYDIERAIAQTLRPPARRFAEVKLYVLITESLCKRPWIEVAEQVILGGADCLQLREKNLDSGELLNRARRLASLCRAQQKICIINDRPDIALLADADGVHLGQSDLPAIEARKLLGSQKLIGVSTHNLDQAKKAVMDGADYIGVGPFFVSSTKRRDFLAGPAYAAEVARAISIPAVAIAGITEQNVDEVTATGVRAIAVTAAVCAVDDPREAAERLKGRLLKEARR